MEHWKDLQTRWKVLGSYYLVMQANAVLLGPVESLPSLIRSKRLPTMYGLEKESEPSTDPAFSILPRTIEN